MSRQVGRTFAKQPPGRAVVFVVLLLIVAGGVGLWWSLVEAPRPIERAPLADPTAGGSAAEAVGAQYVGNRVCRECHPGISAQHARSGHARTLRRAGRTDLARNLDGQTIPDPEDPQVTWTYHLQDEVLTAERAEAGRIERAVLEYAFGSGEHGVTLLTSLGPGADGRLEGLEHRLSFYPPDDEPRVTPGQGIGDHAGEGTALPLGRRLDADGLVRCFSCHVTLTSDQGNERLDLATMIPNVSCERCHGPGRAHVEAAERGDDDLAIAFGSLEPAPGDAEIRMCGSCHRLPLDFPPSHVRPENPQIVRFQPVGLTHSWCYIRSGGALKCTSCHDPHARTSRDTTAYESVCLSCHQGNHQRICSVSTTEGCVGCHMPRRTTSDEFLFTDHWIRVVPPDQIGESYEKATPTPASSE